MNIFDFYDYRDYIKANFSALPNSGYGKLAELADSSGVNRATITLVLKKERDFTSDQAFNACQFLGLNKIETDYFLNSVQMQKAAQTKVRNHYRDKLDLIRNEHQDLQKRLGKSKEFDENAKAQFYSNWFYSAIRLSTSIAENDNIDTIAKHLDLPLNVVKQVVDFLLEHKLVSQIDNKLKIIFDENVDKVHSIEIHYVNSYY
ncbi:MAG: TIGR02147 family protein, partial [Pseudobdellovibrio sp.]